VVGSADGVIVIGGSWGTLSELALTRHLGLPVVSIGGWSVVDSDGSIVAIDQVNAPVDAVSRMVALLLTESGAHDAI
jgi:predicted Rossmann-fold nucleotide-binding protein